MIVVRADLVAEGLGFPEGPLVMPDGRIAFVEEYLGRISVWDGTEVTELAYLGGNPNGLALGSDQRIYATRGRGMPGSRPATPAIISVDPQSGAWDVLAVQASGRPLRAPNDLCFGPDGALYFTDPDGFDPGDESLHGWLCRHDDAGTKLLFDLGNVHPNGLAFDPSGSLVWVESVTGGVVMAIGDDPTVIAELGGPNLPDGCAFTEDGILVVATFQSGGLHVVDWRDGDAQVSFELWASGVRATNVAFDGSALWVTDAGEPPHVIDHLGGRLWRLETTLTGLPLWGSASGSGPARVGG